MNNCELSYLAYIYKPYRQIKKQTYKQTDRQTNRDKHTNMQTNIQTYKQIDKLRQTKKTAQNIKLNVNTELSFVTVQF